MATPEVIAEQQALVGINADYKEKFGFHDPQNELRLQGPEGPDEGARRADLRVQERARVDARVPPEGARALPRRPQPTWGSPMLAEVDYDNIHYFVRASEKSSKTWDDVPEDIKNTFDKLGIPEAGAQVPLRRRRPVRVRGRLPPGPRGPREAGRRLHGHGLRPARARGPRARVLRVDHPVQRQQARRAQQRRVVGRLVRLRAAGRARRDAAAGLLPDQHREHGPVRADADHRRRGLLRALRRGLHRAGVDAPTRCTPPSSS